MIYYVKVDEVDFKVETTTDEYGLDIAAVYVRGSEQNILFVLSKGVVSAIENECLKQLEENFDN